MADNNFEILFIYTLKKKLSVYNVFNINKLNRFADNMRLFPIYGQAHK